MRRFSFIAVPRGSNFADLEGQLDKATGKDFSRLADLLGKMKHKEGDFKSALEFYRKSATALEVLVNSGGDKKVKFDYSCALSNVSAALGELGHAEEALRVAESSLVMRKTLLGSTHFAVAESLTNVGRILFMLGRIQRATDAFEEALTLFLSHSDGKEDTPYVAIAYLNVGMAYTRHPCGLEEQGKKAIEKATRLAILVWGENHPETQIFKDSITWKLFVCENEVWNITSFSIVEDLRICQRRDDFATLLYTCATSEAVR